MIYVIHNVTKISARWRCLTSFTQTTMSPMEPQPNCHALRMASAQHVFRAVPQLRAKVRAETEELWSLPEVVPSPVILERFWGRITSVSIRYHNEENKWLGGEELKHWNIHNREVSVWYSHITMDLTHTGLRQVC